MSINKICGSASPTCTAIYLLGLNVSLNFHLLPCNMFATRVAVAVQLPPHRVCKVTLLFHCMLLLPDDLLAVASLHFLG